MGNGTRVCSLLSSGPRTSLPRGNLYNSLPTIELHWKNTIRFEMTARKLLRTG